MAQVSYGTITITDTTDIENIYAVYAGSEDITSAPNTMDFNLWITDVSQVTGYYIWQRIVTKPYGIEITEENFQDYYGAPVCITGAGGRSIENIITYYCNYGEGRPPEGYEGWQIGIPEYNIEKPNYWVKTVIVYTDNFKQTLSLEDDIISIDNNNKQYIKSLLVTLEPIQDLHGYDKPWSGGVGKNKLLNTATSATVSNVSYTVNDDGTIIANGTSSGWGALTIGTFALPSGSYYLSSGITSSNNYFEFILNGAQINNVGVAQKEFTLSEAAEITVKLYARPNTTATNLKLYPMIRLSSVSDATYEPYSNICPISGHDEVNASVCGKNVWEPAVGTQYKNVNGESFNGYNITGLVSALNALPIGTYNISFKFDVLETVSGATTWGILLRNSVSGYIDGRQNGQHNSGETLSFTRSVTVTAENKGRFVNAYLYSGGGSRAKVYWYDFQLELGSTATDYEPYTNTTYEVSFGTAGTVYGGTVDVVSGVLTVDRAIHTFDGTDAVGLANWRPLDNSSGWLYQPSVTQGMTDVQTSITTMSDVLSDTLATQTYANLCASDTNGISIVGGAVWGIGMRVADTSLRTASAINAWLAENPVTVCYRLATPQTYQLTPTEVSLLLGQNNVWSDGTIQFESVSTIGQDVQIYLDKGVTNALVQVQGAIEQANSNINSITRLWYLTDTSNIPNSPNEPITEESIEVINKWSTNKPVAENYRYYYYCDQICTAGGDYSWTDVVPDTSVLLPYEIHSFDTIVKHHWLDSSGYHLASGINNEEIDTVDSSTYGYISTLGLNSLTFGYNDSNAIELSTNALTFYQPPSISQVPHQGKKTMSLTENALRFYNPNDGQTIMAEFNGNGLTIYSKDANNINNPIASYGEEIIVGNKNSFHIKIGVSQGQGELGFYKDETNKIAYLSGDMLYINKSVVVSEMDVGQKWDGVNSFGQWSWKLHKNIGGKNNLNLKWIG